MGSIGVPELILIFVVALLLFGPKKLPEIGRTIGKAMGEFRRATNDLQRSLEEEVAASDLREVRREIKDASQQIEKTFTGEPVQPAAEPATKPAEPANAAAQASPESSETKVMPEPTEPK